LHAPGRARDAYPSGAALIVVDVLMDDDLEHRLTADAALAGLRLELLDDLGIEQYGGRRL